MSVLESATESVSRSGMVDQSRGANGGRPNEREKEMNSKAPTKRTAARRGQELQDTEGLQNYACLVEK